MLIEIGFSFTCNEALKHYNKANSKQRKLEGALNPLNPGELITALLVHRGNGEAEGFMSCSLPYHSFIFISVL